MAAIARPSPAAPEQRPVTTLRGVGESLAEKLAKLGVFTVQDLLFLLPLRYEDRTRIVPIGTLTPGERAVVEANVDLTQAVFRGRRQLLCRVTDRSGFLTLRFFHFNTSQQEGLARGARVRCYGEVRRGSLGLEIVHPEYRILKGEAAAEEMSDTLTPIYPATEGVQQGRLRRLVDLAFESLGAQGPRDLLPDGVAGDLSLPTLREALDYVHRPPPDASLAELAAGRHPSQRRLAFEELLAQQLSLRLLRSEIRRDPAAPLASKGDLVRRLLAALPFKLTNAQQRAYAEVEADLRRDEPMLRLIQGDVGCGKTVVAALAAAQAVEAGYQVAVMAPTELLAEQHTRNFTKWFSTLGVDCVLLTGKLPARKRTQVLEGTANESLPLIIGTHALFQEGVQFRNLALAIVDEQHRFGVHQRMQLRQKGAHAGRYPHQLIMTATPIPRTLAMTAYADLDLTIVDELPPGRTPIQTVVMPEKRRDEIVARVRQACLEKGQAYWVCPAIEENEEFPYQAAEELATQLAAALPELKVGLIHGRVPSAQKERTMHAFQAGGMDVLVATTVIEVGVDVPNAGIMVIENAERMGLAQLHQLRGRVGRGSRAGTCVLLYRAPLSQMARERLQVLRETNDGFEVARRDLELRGPGEMLGTRQTGLAQMRVADLVRDADLLPQVQAGAQLMQQRHAAHIPLLIDRWVAHSGIYGKVG